MNKAIPVVGLTLLLSPALARKGDVDAPIRIVVQDEQGNMVAHSDPQSKKSAAVELALNRGYQPGDQVRVDGAMRMAVRFDATMPECLVYIPAGSTGFTYEIPYGREEKQTGSAYGPQQFAGTSHQIAARRLSTTEKKAYRNLALNPCDFRMDADKPIRLYPHASTNSVSRSLFDFEARNAIDGISRNGHHGLWPYQSWGPQLRTDLWWQLDFGRSVELDKIRLMIRTDFPHDSYWKSADVEFSDKTRISIRINSTDAFQDFPFPKRRVSSFRLTNLVPTDSDKWCALMEVEAWGRDLP